jgi:signal transduction histidine kinase
MENSDDLPISQRENLSIIRTSSDDLQRIVTAVLDWSKLDAGSVQAESIDFDLRSIVEAATVTVGHIAQAKSVELVIENSVDTDPVWTLLGDPHRFRQCLLNILSNALKFTPLAHGDVKPTVRLRWTLDERAESVDITLAIQDEGIGIPRRAMNKLFGAFVQGHSGISRSHGGSGLGGLSKNPKLVNAIAEPRLLLQVSRSLVDYAESWAVIAGPNRSKARDQRSIF